MDFKAWKPSDADELTPAVIHQIVCDIEDGNPDPEQSKRLLRYFVDHTNPGSGSGLSELPQPLLRYLWNAFTAYLNDPEAGKLEKLLGLKLPRKRPNIREQRDHQIAWDVLDLRLKGLTLEEASAELVDKYHIGSNKIRDIWAKHKGMAFDFEAISRAHESPDSKIRWNDDEVRRLKKIYGKAIRTP